MPHVVKRAAYWLAPSLYVTGRYWWHDRQGRLQDKRLHKALFVNDRTVVRGGPFAGMVYFSQAVGSALSAKIVGSYEEEIAPVIERIIAKQPTCVIDIGCAEGYYAVGFARRLPSTRVYAFDIDRNAQALCRRTARANGVDARVSIGGECTIDRLKELMTANTTILSDCEGCEMDLLNPQHTSSSWQ